ncbi:MAG: permease prefix domain 1-containing protein [Defluviitaleaceae bacterium]|nr:permease prefix domain 1-containing protein [Defluviitaleaceae bacterium]
MHEKRIAKMVNDLFYDIVETDEVREQKEELLIHLTEKTQEFMKKGLSFDESLAAARASLGDPDELVGGFERKRAVVVEEVDDEYGVNVHFRVGRMFTKLTPLAPFIYILMGVFQSSWRPLLPFDVWNWWTWGWVIIPVFGILSSGIGTHTITALSPFIYVTIGIIYGGSWWAWGWMIIPISGILFSSGGGKKKKKKKKKMIYAYTDAIVEAAIDGDVEGIHEAVQDLKDFKKDYKDRQN